LDSLNVLLDNLTFPKYTSTIVKLLLFYKKAAANYVGLMAVTVAQRSTGVVLCRDFPWGCT
jgi:hypothetical protein